MPVLNLAQSLDTDQSRLHNYIDEVRNVMEGEIGDVRERCRTYLNWYSPPFDHDIKRHDAWEDPIDYQADAGTTRDNFPISRAVVDIWTSLEAAKQPIPRGEPESVPPPLPQLDQGQAAIERAMYTVARTVESRKSDIRSRRFRQWLRRDGFALKHFAAVRRKNLYGFSWMKVIPNPYERRPETAVVRDPTTVFPIWSTRHPDKIEALLSVQKKNARLADAQYGLDLAFHPDGRVHFGVGGDTGRYQEVNDRHYDSTRTHVWEEDFWWIERDFDNDAMRERQATVHNVVRVMGRVVHYRSYQWMNLPWVYWENHDERDYYGWSDVANVIDINDEFNRRLSEEGDILAMYSQPRFQLLGAIGEREVEMPGPLELITLQDVERIEQILTRIDVYPSQIHLQTLTDMLHRVTGLPPIVWGLIANAQTSGRALTASWKATETRLTPKLMRNRQSLDNVAAIFIDYARHYDWEGGRAMFTAMNQEDVFNDIRWKFPPMEPRDFQEVTMDAITRRDAGLTTSVKAIRDTGDEDAEETWEEVKGEFNDIDAHPDKVQSKILAQRAQLDNMQFAQQLGAQAAGPTNNATVMQTVGQAREAAGTAPAAAPAGVEGALPPTSPGAAGNAGQPEQAEGTAPGADGEMLTSGTLVRGGEVSNQFLQTRRMG